MAEREGEEYSMVHKFQNQSADFVLGFEAGRFWQECNTDGFAEGTYHARNEGELLRIAGHFRLQRLEWDKLNEDFYSGKFGDA